MRRVTLCQLFLVLFLIPMLCSPCLAHKVRIFAWQDGDNIITESKFSGGRAAQNATVSVIATKTGQTLLSGKTDTAGIFQFPVPKTDAKELQIIVDGGDGHKNSWDYTLEDSSATGDSPPQPAVSNPSSQAPLQAPSAQTTEPNLPAVTAVELSRIIDTALDKKLAPIKRTLAENSEKSPTLQDILSGIGYILGLAGIAAYMQARKKQQGERS